MSAENTILKVQRFTEWLPPLHWIVFPVEFLPKAFIHWMPCPHSVKRRFSSLIFASSHPLPQTQLQQLPLTQTWKRSEAMPFSRSKTFRITRVKAKAKFGVKYLYGDEYEKIICSNWNQHESERGKIPFATKLLLTKKNSGRINFGLLKLNWPLGELILAC